MTGREWKPGDVALVTYRCANGGTREVRCFMRGAWWHPADQRIATLGSSLGEVVSVRPLVVIDPEDRKQVERLRFEIADLVSYSQLREALDAFADPKPPKPDEPTGLGAVIEAIHNNYFVRIDRGVQAWRRVGDEVVDNAHLCRWSDIDVVRVLSEGWSE